MVDLSWAASSEILGEGSLLTEGVSLTGSISGLLADRIQGSTVYLKNNSNEEDPVLNTAYNLGFYCKAYAENYGFQKILEWSRIEDPDGKPYGVFIVFGYDGSNNSYIDKYLANTLTAEELSYFQVNYSQGKDYLNPILLKRVNTFNEGSYSKIQNLNTFNNSAGAHPTSGEATGLVKVCIGARIPDSIEATRVLINLSVAYEEV